MCCSRIVFGFVVSSVSVNYMLVFMSGEFGFLVNLV